MGEQKKSRETANNIKREENVTRNRSDVHTLTGRLVPAVNDAVYHQIIKPNLSSIPLLCFEISFLGERAVLLFSSSPANN